LSTTLLLVDDDPQNLELLEAILEPLGHKLLLAHGGQEALDILARDRIDLLLLDVMMPGVSGFEVLSQLRARPTYRQVPVVLITAAGDREYRLKGLQLGATEFLEKPVDQPILLARIRSLLQLQFVSDQLIRRNEKLEVLQQNQEELMHFIAHDLRNPLAVIRTNLGFLRIEANVKGADRLAAIEDSERAVRRADAMIADLLTVARAEQVTLEVDKRPLSLSLLMHQVHASYAPEAEWRGIALETDIDSGIQLVADADLLRRVLENIVSNALRHTPKGGRIRAQALSRETVEIRLANTGPPIPIEERERVFEKFWRAKGSPKAGVVGLGLYFCRVVVEAHGGRITVEESDGWPAVFVITLPVYQGPVVIK
jgi:two-component system, sensor histidine kinase and response regulator